MNMIHERYIWNNEPVIGERVSGRVIGTHGRHTWNTAFEGIYDGVQPSQWTGEPMHMFRDGVMGQTPQGHFGFPVATDRLPD